MTIETKNGRNIPPTLFNYFLLFSLDFNSFPNALWSAFPMCSTPVCGFLCGQKQCFARAIPVQLCGILGISMLQSMRHHGNRVGPPAAWDAIIKEDGYAELVVDISVFGWYRLVVETSILAFTKEERSHAGLLRDVYGFD